jgi:hypothetical protein
MLLLSHPNLDDINYEENVLYKINNQDDYIDVETPILVINTLDSCFSHALVENVFSWFWILQELKNIRPEHSNFFLFVKKDVIEMYPWNKLNIDEKTKSYKGFHKDLFDLLSPYVSRIIFEHLLDSNYKFHKVFYYPHNDFYSRTIWGQDTRGGIPNIQIKEKFTTDIILQKYIEFRENGLNLHNIKIITPPEKKILLIDRKYNRKFNSSLLNQLQSTFHCPVYIMEDLNLHDQMQLFSSHNVFIFRHGSCLANLLWIPNASIVFDIQGGPEGALAHPNIIKKLCLLTNSKSILLDYNKLNITDLIQNIF